MSTILKVQSPLMTTGDVDEWLFYNELRTIWFMRVPSPKEIRLMADDMRMFAEYSPVGEIQRRVEDKDW